MSQSEPPREDDTLNITTPPQKLNAEWVPRDAIDPNDWNPNTMSEEEHKLLRRAISNQGWTQPIVVHAEDDYIIDGEQRWTCAAHEDIQTADYLTPDGVPAGHVPIFRITVDEEQAKIATLQHNRARGFVEYDSLYDYFEEFDEKGALDEVTSELGWDDEEVLRLVEQQTVAGAVGGDNDIGEAWEPVDVRELDDDTIEYASSSESLKDSDNAGEAADRIMFVLSPNEREFVEAVLSEDDMSNNLLRYVKFIFDNDLEDAFRDTTEIEPSDEYPHPDDIEDDDEDESADAADEPESDE